MALFVLLAVCAAVGVVIVAVPKSPPLPTFPDDDAAADVAPPKPWLTRIRTLAVWLIAAGVVLVGVSLTSWWGVAVACAALVIAVPLNRESARKERHRRRTAQLVVNWAEQIRALLMAGMELTPALRESALQVPDRRFVRFATSLDILGTSPALYALSRELASPQADLIIGVLVAAAEETTRRIADAIDGLCVHLREETAVMDDVEAGRGGLRLERNMTAVMGVAVMVLIATAGGLGRYYADWLGQVAILVVGVMFGAAYWIMMRLERFKLPRGFVLRDRGRAG